MHLKNQNAPFLNSRHENPEAETTFLIHCHRDLETLMGAFIENPEAETDF